VEWSGPSHRNTPGRHWFHVLCCSAGRPVNQHGHRFYTELDVTHEGHTKRMAGWVDEEIMDGGQMCEKKLYSKICKSFGGNNRGRFVPTVGSKVGVKGRSLKKFG